MLFDEEEMWLMSSLSLTSPGWGGGGGGGLQQDLGQQLTPQEHQKGVWDKLEG